jgi:SAM-dependent methyltransferase
MIGVRPDGTKELIAVEDGYRESAESWKTVLRDLKRRGMRPPVVAVGDGALGFWAAVRDVWPKTREQRDWSHKLGNILDKLPKRVQPRVKAADLASAPVEALPYDDASFDAVVSVSTLEFIDDLDQVCRELVRVLRPGGVGVFITPGFSPVLDLGLRALTGERAEDTFRGRRQWVLPALDRHFHLVRTVRFPRAVRPWLYTGVRATRPVPYMATRGGPRVPAFPDGHRPAARGDDQRICAER